MLSFGYSIFIKELYLKNDGHWFCIHLSIHSAAVPWYTEEPIYTC
jgi:hypothetical protein